MRDREESGEWVAGTLKERVEAIRARIARAARRAGRDPASVTLVAVSKTVPVARLVEAAACGCRIFGENRVQEALAKMEVIGARALLRIEWHLLGPLQTNKIKSAMGRFTLLHAVDRMEVAERLDRAARERGLVQRVLLQVNVAREKTKHGFMPEEVLPAAERMGMFAGLRVLGLMTIPPPAAAPEEARPHLGRLRELAARVEALGIPGVAMTELSMGMSADFETAIEEGATLVRIGTTLFGPRPVG